MKRTLTTIMLGLLLTASACKKKDEAKTDDKPGEPAKPADQKPTEPPPAGGVTAGQPAGELTAADYEKKDVEMMDKAVAAFGSADADCAKAAASVSKFFDENKAQMEALEAYEKAHPDVQKQVEDKYKDKTKAFMDNVGKLMERCKDNPAMKDAMAKIPD